MVVLNTHGKTTIYGFNFQPPHFLLFLLLNLSFKEEQEDKTCGKMLEFKMN
jgi:hypothetical protein